MGNDQYARYGAATGIVALILIVVGYFVFSQDIPDTDAEALEWAGWYVENDGQIQTGLTLVGIGLFFYVWFLGSIRSALAAAEGGAARLASVAFAGGLVSAGFFLVAITASAAAAFRPDEVDPTITMSLHNVGLVVAAPAAAGFTALFAASSIVGYRRGAFSPGVSGVLALAALTQPFAYGVAVTDSGAFAGDGVLGLWVPFVGFVVGILVLSVTLTRSPGEEPAPAPATPTA